MKIGIVTAFNAVNYGGFCQAFALQETLKEMGYSDIYMLKHNSLAYMKWRMIALTTYKIKKIPFQFKLSLGYFKAWKNFTATNKKKGYDLIIVGSDEMWNLKNKTMKSLPIFFGEGLSSKRYVTYAVSANNTTSDDVGKQRDIQKWLQKFAMISVRDTGAYEAYKPFVNKEIQLTLDPTLLLDLNKYAVLPDIKDYILVYTYSFKPFMIERVKEYAKRVNKRIVVAGFDFPWADYCVPADPFEFLGYIKNSSMVITDTFHGTVLSIALRKQFMTFADHKVKVRKILEQLNLMSRNISNVEVISEVASQTIDYKQIEKQLNGLREHSLDYLRKAIGDFQNDK